MSANVTLTRHAGTRLQQRGIKSEAVARLLEFGSVEFDHMGGRIFYFDKRSWRRLEKALGERGAPCAEHLDGIYAVVGDDGAVITVGHRQRRILHDRKPPARGRFGWQHRTRMSDYN